MRLIYFGSGPFGLPTLARLAAEHRVELVVTQPDRPAGRRRHLRTTPVSALAAKCGLPTVKAADVNDASTMDRIHSVGAEAFVVIAFGQKLAAPLVDESFAVNLHGSLVPRYRGAAPVNWAIINGDRETGLSVIRITQRIDAGDILAQRATPIDPMETAGELEERLADMGPELMLETLAKHETGELRPTPQDERLACRAPKLSKSDGTVCFEQPAPAVQHRVHGLTPWPGCTVTLDGRRLKLTRVDVADEEQTQDAPGVMRPDGTVACAAGSIRLLAVQPPGGKQMSFSAYCHGHDLQAPSRLEPL